MRTGAETPFLETPFPATLFLETLFPEAPLSFPK
jgi:hypothetical protein